MRRERVKGVVLKEKGNFSNEVKGEGMGWFNNL